MLSRHRNAARDYLRNSFATQAALLLYLETLEWVNPFPWNDIPRDNRQARPDIALRIATTLAILATWRRKRWVIGFEISC